MRRKTLRMLLQPAFGCIALTILLLVSVLWNNKFGRQGQNLRLTRFHKDGRHGAVVKMFRTVAIRPFQALRTRDLFGREEIHPVQRDGVGLQLVLKSQQMLLASQFVQDVPEIFRKRRMCEWINQIPNLGIAWYFSHLKQTAGIVAPLFTLQ